MFFVGVGAALPLSNNLTKILRKFTLQHVYNDKKSQSLAESRASKWKKMKKKSTQRLPPDEDSHDLRARRVNYQCYIYRSYSRKDAPPSPSNHGWTITEGKICI